MNTPVFENDVKMYGIQTIIKLIAHSRQFENDVKMYGIQTVKNPTQASIEFENDVKMYGIQTVPCIKRVHYSLRMM